MIEIILALIAAFSKGIEKIFHRFILSNHDPIAYNFIWHLLTAILFLPLFFIEFKMPENNLAWILVFISSAMWALVGYVMFKTYSILDISFKAPLDKSRILFGFIFAILIFKESINIEKIIGVILISISLLFISIKKKKKNANISTKGIIYTILSGFLLTLTLLLDKFSMTYFNPGMYSFLVYFIPSLILIPTVINKKKEIKILLTKKFKYLFLTVLLGAIYYYLLLKAFQIGEASIILPIIEMSALIAVLGGIIFLKERKDILRKLIAIVIAIIGTLFISGIIIF